VAIKLNQNEQELVDRGKESLAFIRSDVSYRHWLDYGLAIDAGAGALQRALNDRKRPLFFQPRNNFSDIGRYP
jgi:hypothetical protein